MRCRSGRTKHQPSVSIRREDHVKQLGKILGVSLVLIGLKDVEKVAGIKTLAKLLDCLGTNAVNAEKVFFGLTNQIPNRLNANLRELIGPALGNPKVVKEVQLGILT